MCIMSNRVSIILYHSKIAHIATPPVRVYTCIILPVAVTCKRSHRDLSDPSFIWPCRCTPLNEKWRFSPSSPDPFPSLRVGSGDETFSIFQRKFVPQKIIWRKVFSWHSSESWWHYPGAYLSCCLVARKPPLVVRFSIILVWLSCYRKPLWFLDSICRH